MEDREGEELHHSAFMEANEEIQLSHESSERHRVTDEEEQMSTLTGRNRKYLQSKQIQKNNKLI